MGLIEFQCRNYFARAIIMSSYQPEVRRVGNLLKGPEHNLKLEGSLGLYIWNACDTFGDKLCQISAETGESETFSSLKTRATKLAIRLRNLGIGKGDVILTCTPNTLDSCVPATATLFLGAISSAFDPSLSVRDCVHLITSVKPKIIFVDPNSIELIEEVLATAVDIHPEIIVFGKYEKYKSFADFSTDVSEEEVEEFVPEPMEDDDTAFVMFSSGTTGMPKGICLSHRSSYIGSNNFMNTINHPVRMTHFTTFYWISAIFMYVGQFSNGTTRVLMNKFEPKTSLLNIAKYKVIALFMATTYAYMLNQIEDISRYDLSSVKYIIFSGSPLSAQQLTKLRGLIPNAFCYVGFGMTELSGFGAWFVDSERELAYANPTSCGRPIAGTTLKIVDPESEKLLGPNERGELRVKSDSLMVGYYGIDSSSAFDEEGFIKSGDIGHYDENCCVYIYDRIKDLFKYNSWHIVPASVENVVLQHPDVLEVVVFGIPHEESEHLPAAAVTLRPGHDVKVDDIREFVDARVLDRERLRGGVFVVESIPKTPSQKVMRRKVKEMILQHLGSRNV